MKNSFQLLQEADEMNFELPSEIEYNVVSQAETFSFFGKVVELFIPNALNTVAKMVGGDASRNLADGSGRGAPNAMPAWRVPPTGRPGAH